MALHKNDSASDVAIGFLNPKEECVERANLGQSTIHIALASLSCVEEMFVQK